jgi:hypothetical protein
MELFGQISVHFEVRQHHISAALFTETTNDVSKIIDELDRILFGTTLKYELVVLPPLAGTFLSRYGIRILGGAGILWAALDTDIGAGFIKGLTGEVPAYWAEQAGHFTSENFKHVNDLLDDTKIKSSSNQVQRVATELVMAASTRCILEKTPNQLRNIGLNAANFRAGFEAKNDFYEACTLYNEIKAIGFTKEDDFPIKRKNFGKMRVTLPKKQVDELDYEWQVQIADLRVTSPNWERKDARRSWKGKTVQDKECYFRIEDEGFWLLALQHKLQLDVVDTLKVQWAFKVVDGVPRDHQVIKVLNFNGNQLADPLNENAIEAILGRYIKVSEDLPEYDLFTTGNSNNSSFLKLPIAHPVQIPTHRFLSRKIKFDE